MSAVYSSHIRRQWSGFFLLFSFFNAIISDLQGEFQSQALHLVEVSEWQWYNLDWKICGFLWFCSGFFGGWAAVSVMYFVKYGSLTFEFKNMTWKFVVLQYAYVGLIVRGNELIMVFSIWLESWNRLVIHMHYSVIDLKFFGMRKPYSLKSAKSVVTAL